MSSPSKIKGTRYESEVRDYLRSRRLEADRMVLNGTADEGDLLWRFGGQPFILECKNVRQMDLAGWIGEAEREAENYGEARKIEQPHFAVVHKRRNKGVAESYVTLPLSEYVNQITDGIPF